MLRGTMTNPASAAAERALGARLGDRLILPSTPGYDDARRVFNGMIDRRPAAIARCATPEDVAAAFRFGQDEGLLTAVRAWTGRPTPTGPTLAAIAALCRLESVTSFLY